jgi:hypothetical protein
LKDVLARLPTNKNRQIEELLPHRWQPVSLELQSPAIKAPVGQGVLVRLTPELGR